MPAAKPPPVITPEEAALDAAFKLARRQLGTLNSAEIVRLRELLRGSSIGEAVSSIRQARYAPSAPPAAPDPEADPGRT